MIDYTGQVFGKLRVIRLLERVVGKRPKYECLCECGNTTVVQSNNLQSGITTTCGCSRIRKYRKDFAKEVYPDTKHNNTGISKKEYISIHDWIKTHYGKAIKCEHCKKLNAKRYEWALIKGLKYERNIDNYIQLCKQCHFKYDLPDNPKNKIWQWTKLKLETS